jgi:hypothetical protein
MKSFRFVFDDDEAFESAEVFYPQKKIEHLCVYPDDVMWNNVLMEFCTFLESTGYHGVTRKVELGLSLVKDSDETFGNS